VFHYCVVKSQGKYIQKYRLFIYLIVHVCNLECEIINTKVVFQKEDNFCIVKIKSNNLVEIFYLAVF
jgi:hypothetical protein